MVKFGMLIQDNNDSALILSTLNARYMHSAFGLRCLFANLGGIQPQAQIIEFTIQQRPIDIVERLLATQPEIISFGIYIWNVEETTAVVALLREIAPRVMVILGGPEVSHPPDLPEIVELADYVITGPAEISFKQLCDQLLGGKKPLNKIISGVTVPLDQLVSPYPFYNDEDIKNRLIYVEASRGCPFKCEFCLSSLDKTAKPFALDLFLQEMESLLARGARNFKFIDRTFNLKVSTSVKIMEFFLDRMTDDLYLHFEVIPDNLPEPLKLVLRRFPVGSLQFEIGVQTFDPEIQTRISRKQDNQKTRENLQWIRTNTAAHIHADLIFGLPGDSLDNFSQSFNQLVALNPQEIQLGILKRLRGAPLNRHTTEFAMRYNPKPPYNILQTADIDFTTMQRMTRFARYWDLIGNSGRFNHALPQLLGDNPFFRFLELSDAIFQLSSATWKISLKRLFELLHVVAIESLEIPRDVIEQALMLDYKKAGLKGVSPFLNKQENSKVVGSKANKRQLKHLAHDNILQQ